MKTTLNFHCIKNGLELDHQLYTLACGDFSVDWSILDRGADPAASNMTVGDLIDSATPTDDSETTNRRDYTLELQMNRLHTRTGATTNRREYTVEHLMLVDNSNTGLEM